MKYSKYHALGNDYLVVDPKDWEGTLTEAQVRRVCHRNFGVGSDGVLYGPLPHVGSDFALRIFNPDGSEAEKSGNGLRIFSRYLFDQHLVGEGPFTIHTLGGRVQSQVLSGGKLVRVEMGKVTFWSGTIPVSGPPREVLLETIEAGDRTFTFCAASIGNPHCVISLPEISPELARRYGPLIETHPSFPKRTNVQFLKLLDRQNLQLEIWERGAGYTLASGSSSSAAAAVARKLGLCDASVTVHMPGGQLAIQIHDDFSVLMTGPVTRIADGLLHDEVFADDS